MRRRIDTDVVDPVRENTESGRVEVEEAGSFEVVGDEGDGMGSTWVGG